MVLRSIRRYSFSTSRRVVGHQSLSALASLAPLPFEDEALKAMVLDQCAFANLPGSDTTMPSDCTQEADSTLDQPIDFDGCDDGVMSDVDDEEAFNAVFPQAPALVKQHALKPLIDVLRLLLARPGHLFEALIVECDGEMRVQDVAVLEAKATEYMQLQIEEKLRKEDWTRMLDVLQRRSTPHDRWVAPELVEQVDHMMFKLTLHYTRLWELVSMVAVKKVHEVESIVVELITEFTRNNSTSNGGGTKPPMDSTAIFRPLRLRSQTPRNGSTKNDDVPSSSTTDTGSTGSKDAAYRRSRIARQSNEFMIAWFLHHKANPYPSASDRVHISEKTGLTEQQVRNWFANMRKRHWKPHGDKKKEKKPRCLLDMLLRQNDEPSAKTTKA